MNLRPHKHTSSARAGLRRFIVGGHSRRNLSRRPFSYRPFSYRMLRASFFAVIAGALFLSAAPAVAQKDEASEYAVKLGFLYNFTKFIEWPPEAFRDSAAPLVICIVGRDPFRPDREAELRTRKVGDHPVAITSKTQNDTLTACHIVFVPVTEKNQADKILRSLQGSKTLTVGETEGFAALGGSINLVLEDNKVHFEINRLAADRAGLRIGSRLLGIAKIVKEQTKKS